MENLITEKQMSYIMKLDPSKTAETLKELSIKDASILICKLKKQKPVKTNFKHGFNVGDVLYSSWGWEQTNLDFFQVVRATESSIWVKEVVMKKTMEDGISSMSRDIAYDPKSAKPIEHSFWFKDEEQQGKGKLLRVGTYNYNGKTNYYANVHGRYGLYHYEGQKLYESWYA